MAIDYALAPDSHEPDRPKKRMPKWGIALIVSGIAIAMLGGATAAAISMATKSNSAEGDSPNIIASAGHSHANDLKLNCHIQKTAKGALMVIYNFNGENSGTTRYSYSLSVQYWDNASKKWVDGGGTLLFAGPGETVSDSTTFTMVMNDPRDGGAGSAVKCRAFLA